MPIYEFYCSRCHAVYNFLSRKADPDGVPPCPKCGRPDLERQASRFAVSKNRPDSGPDDGLDGLDESRMERVMEDLAGEMEGMNEDDPRQMARMMRRLTEAAGMEVNPSMEEAISRLEKGENPDKVEEEMGDLFGEGDEGEGPFTGEGLFKKSASPARKHLSPAKRDDALYEM